MASYSGSFSDSYTHTHPTIDFTVSASSSGITVSYSYSWSSDESYFHGSITVYVSGGSYSSSQVVFGSHDGPGSGSGSVSFASPDTIFDSYGASSISISMDCTLCSDNPSWTLTDNRYTAPSGYSITITGVTGTTITATHSWTEGTTTATTHTLTCNGSTQSVSNNGSFTFTGLTNATGYTVSGSVNDGRSSLSGSTSTTTYGCTVSVASSSITTKTAVITVAGRGYNYTGTITYQVRTSSYTGSIVKSGTISITNNSSNTATVTGLTPATTYYVTVYETSVTDATAQTTFTTKTAFSNVVLSLTSTGKTVTATVTWTANGSTGISAKIKNGSSGTEYTISSSGGTKTWSSLTQGTNYTIYVTVTDDESNSISTNGSVYTYSITINTPSFSSSASLKFDTEAIMFSATIATGDSQKSSRTLKYTITNSSGTSIGSATGLSGSTANVRTHSGLQDNTTYTITYDVEQFSDATKTATITTASLTVENSSATWNQNSMTSTWQAYATSGSTKNAYNTTYVRSISITLSTSTSNTLYCSCTANATSGYQTNETTPTRSGSYPTLSYSNLTYYSYYTVVCAITDGTNYASASIKDHTTFPYMYIYNNGWKKCMPYVYNGSSWVLAPAYVYNGSAWKYCNGE